MSKHTTEQQEAIDRLRAMLPPGTRLHTKTTRYVRASGNKSVAVYHVTTDGDRGPDVIDISGLVARVTRLTFDRDHGGVKVGGDSEFGLVHALGEVLYPDGFTCTGDRCASNDHSNGDRDYSPHHHRSGGYAFNHNRL